EKPFFSDANSFTWPIWGLFNFLEPNPICTARYPFFSSSKIWVTVQGPASRTVAGCAFPFSSYICVMPTFFPRMNFIPLEIYEQTVRRCPPLDIATTWTISNGIRTFSSGSLTPPSPHPRYREGREDGAGYHP